MPAPPSNTTKMTQLHFPLHLVFSFSLSLLLVLAQINGCWWAKVLSTAESHSATLYNFLLCSCSILILWLYLPPLPTDMFFFVWKTFRRVWLKIWHIDPWHVMRQDVSFVANFCERLICMFLFKCMHFGRRFHLKWQCFKSGKFLTNRTRDLGIASAMLQQLSC